MIRIVCILGSIAIVLNGCGTPESNTGAAPTANIGVVAPETAPTTGMSPTAIPTTAPSQTATSPPTEQPATLPAGIAPLQPNSTVTPVPAATTSPVPMPTATRTFRAVPAPIQQPPLGDPAILPDELLTLLRDDLAARTGSAPMDIVLIGAESVLWNDGSLGCRQPGVQYTQEPVAGYRVMLQVAGRDYDYRVGERNRFMLCERP